MCVRSDASGSMPMIACIACPFFASIGSTAPFSACATPLNHTKTTVVYRNSGLWNGEQFMNRK